ncbi:Lrp/AsnC family transcriptional regulator [Halobacterium litoreum]|uniref:Lrp/AsnC family transcriptional regulator n=1 Tax=Halobacterium litoreum TaxID=2039234 RepID=A0ABD5NG90_9EURY|nr:Lrp/AsnC family transcriptional regulator [Halobacterium litoreum]UHH12922.1 Lrp/AsnC family transcriptional regulator [Halobacterium litoreum]
MPHQLDDTDRELLRLLQSNARYTATELADRIGVSDNTVHNRMARLEDAGVITGYKATVDPGEAGLDLFFHFICTTRISNRADVAEQIMTFPEVLEVTELMTGQENLHIKMVGATDRDVTDMAERLDELPLEINDETLIRTNHTKPIDFTSVPGTDRDDE